MIRGSCLCKRVRFEIRVPHHIFVASKAPWVEIADGLPQYPEGSTKTS